MNNCLITGENCTHRGNRRGQGQPFACLKPEGPCDKENTITLTASAYAALKKAAK